MGRLAVALTAVGTLIAGSVVGGMEVAHLVGHKIEQANHPDVDYLKRCAMVGFTVHDGDTPDTLLREVNPNGAPNGDWDKAEYFVQRQGTGTDKHGDPELARTQGVEVPELDKCDQPVPPVLGEDNH